jgi:aspartyl/asparaginyl-tRNA synthetase
MSTKILIAVLAAVLLLLPGMALGVGPELSSNELIEGAKEHDGQEIVYIGEAVGDVMARGDYAWINVNDGNNALGIWAKIAETSDIGTLGGYTKKGTTVKVTGEFHRACPEHGGDMDIHASDIGILKEGYEVLRETNTVKKSAAFILFSGALICLGFTVRKLFAK